MKSIVISNEYDVVQGTKLAGLNGEYSKDENTLKDIFLKNIKNKNIGTIILTEDTEKILASVVNSHRDKGVLPLIVTIPGEDGLRDENFIMRNIKESLGVKID